jgi:hypothetical protein
MPANRKLSGANGNWLHGKRDEIVLRPPESGGVLLSVLKWLLLIRLRRPVNFLDGSQQSPRFLLPDMTADSLGIKQR